MPDDFRQVLACVEASIKGQIVGRASEMFNVLHFQCDHAQPNLGDIENVISFVKTWAQTVYTQNFSQDVHIVEIRAQSLYASAAPFDFVTVDYVGTQNTADEFEHAPLMLLHGPLSTRHQSGKFYAFPPGGVQSADGYPLAYFTNMTNALSNLSLNSRFAGYGLAVASRDLGTCVTVQSIGHTDRLTIQKRRRVGFGR